MPRSAGYLVATATDVLNRQVYTGLEVATSPAAEGRKHEKVPPQGVADGADLSNPTTLEATTERVPAATVGGPPELEAPIDVWVLPQKHIGIV